MTPRVVVIGDVMRDVLVRPEGPLAPGADTRAEIIQASGGSGANQAAWLAAMGVPARMIGRVGAADHAALCAEFRAAGVDPALAADAQAPTGMLVALIDPDGQRSFYTSRGANDRLCPDDLPLDLIRGAALLHVSGYAMVAEGPRGAVAAAMRDAAAMGVPVSVDPGSASFLREIGPDRFAALTAPASFCFPNRDEAAVLAASDDPAIQAARLGARYQVLAIKDGAGPAQIFEGGVLVAQGAPAPIRAIDTTGAGDAFFAGFIAARLGGAAPPDCLAAAHAAGALAVMRLGARPSPQLSTGSLA